MRNCGKQKIWKEPPTFTKPEQYCSQRPYRPLPPHSSSSTYITFKIIFSSYFLKEKIPTFLVFAFSESLKKWTLCMNNNSRKKN
jgi:hypothetical protein